MHGVPTMVNEYVKNGALLFATIALIVFGTEGLARLVIDEMPQSDLGLFADSGNPPIEKELRNAGIPGTRKTL